MDHSFKILVQYKQENNQEACKCTPCTDCRRKLVNEGGELIRTCLD